MVNPKDYDLKITVKLTVRAPLKESDDLRRSLDDIYQEQQIALSKTKKVRRQSTKLRSKQDGLYITRGSWWPTGPAQLKLAYQNILQFSRCASRPAKILLIVTTEDQTQTELVVVKTKGLSFTNQLLSVLQGRVPRAHSIIKEEHGQAKQVTYRVEEVHAHSNDAASLHSSSPEVFLVDRPKNTVEAVIPKTKSVPDYASPNLKNHESTVEKSPNSPPKPQSRPDSIIEFIPLTRLRTNASNQANNNTYQTDLPIQSHNAEEIRNGKVVSNNYELTSQPKEGNSVSEITYYGAKSQPKQVKPSVTTPRKPKRRVPRELKNLNDGSNRMKDMDENNTPWEVNISYIKHDPMVGCVESDSGPIYMYTAHQLVSRPAVENDSYNSVSSSDDDSYTSGSWSDEADSSDEDELERFMMLGRSNNARTNQTQYYTNRVTSQGVREV